MLNFVLSLLWFLKGITLWSFVPVFFWGIWKCYFAKEIYETDWYRCKTSKISWDSLRLPQLASIQSVSCQIGSMTVEFFHNRLTCGSTLHTQMYDTWHYFQKDNSLSPVHINLGVLGDRSKSSVGSFSPMGSTQEICLREDTIILVMIIVAYRAHP